MIKIRRIAPILTCIALLVSILILAFSTHSSRTYSSFTLLKNKGMVDIRYPDSIIYTRIGPLSPREVKSLDILSEKYNVKTVILK